MALLVYEVIVLLPGTSAVSILPETATADPPDESETLPLMVMLPVKDCGPAVVMLFVRAMALPVMLRLSSDLVEPIAPPRLTAPAPALMVR